MMDMLPFPKVSGNSPEEQIVSLVNYMTHFKETLEFALMNISTDNLSSDLVNKLNELGAGIEKNKEEREDEVAQISTKTLTVSDVCNSELFKDAVAREQTKDITFNVNFNNGCLEYTTNEEVNDG